MCYVLASTFFFFLYNTAVVAASVVIDDSIFLFVLDGLFPVLHLTECCCFIFLFSGLYILAVGHLLEFA